MVSLRTILKIGLKEAKDAIESPAGILVNHNVYLDIFHHYMKAPDQNHRAKSHFDWVVCAFNTSNQPVDFTAHPLKGMEAPEVLPTVIREGL